MKKTVEPAAIDFAALEQDIQAVRGQRAADPARSRTDDALSELARIMRQEDPLLAPLGKEVSSAKVASPLSFDDFIRSSGVGSKGQDNVPYGGVEAPMSREAALAADAEDVELDPVVLRGIEDELQARPQDAPSDLLAGLDDDASAVNLDDERVAEVLSIQAELDALDREAAAAQEVAVAPAAEKPKFDDMFAEFEQAMKSVGGERLDPVAAPVSLEPSIVPAPEGTSNGLGMGALASAAAAGAVLTRLGGSRAEASHSAELQPEMPTAEVPEEAPQPRSRRGLMIAAGVIGVAVVGLFSLFSFGGKPRVASSGQAPVIVASPGVVKQRPANPGGADVPDQDKEVLQRSAAPAAANTSVARRDEQPVDLRQAENQQAAGGVRQIPGVTTIIPGAPTAPASPSVAGNQPVPRPVSSVPITIAGAPAAPVAAPVAPPAVAAAPLPVAPAPTTPVPAAAAPAAPPAAPAATPPAAAPRPAPQPAAEPRRVRSVPIREGAEAQAAPAARPVSPPRQQQAARPAPAATDDVEGPLRITPQANRGQPAQRVASAPAPRTQEAPPASSGSFSIQLAAEGSAEAARAKFNQMRSRHSSVLGSYNPNIREADVNGRSVYRVRVGSLSREDAVGLCERLKASGGNCFVARN